jgi:hypothetical protein
MLNEQMKHGTTGGGRELHTTFKQQRQHRPGKLKPEEKESVVLRRKLIWAWGAIIGEEGRIEKNRRRRRRRWWWWWKEKGQAMHDGTAHGKR